MRDGTADRHKRESESHAGLSRWLIVEWHALRKTEYGALIWCGNTAFDAPTSKLACCNSRVRAVPQGRATYTTFQVGKPYTAWRGRDADAAEAEGRVEGRDSWDSPARIAMVRGLSAATIGHLDSRS